VTPALTTTTEAVDTAFYVIFGISAVMLLGITIAMVWFSWRYNRKRQPVPLSQKDHNLWLEIIWTIIPTALVMLMFWYGWEGYLSLRRIPDNAMPIQAEARMWSWLFRYENGASSNKLYVPVGKPVKVELSSSDVLHSFYVPAFRVKRDMVPGLHTYAWFVADKAGSYDLFCAEYCGVGHSAMITTVEALPEAEFTAWLESEKPAAAPQGEVLLTSFGCLGCHSRDGSPLVGPSFKGIAGRKVTVERNGVEVELTSDESYLRKAILDPEAEIVSGFPPVMPAYADQLAESQLQAIVDLLLGNQAARPKPNGAKIASDNGCPGCHSTDGSRLVGPSFKGILGRATRLQGDDGARSVIADRAYLRKAILDPSADIVESYPPAMPPYSHLTQEELEALLDYLEGL